MTDRSELELVASALPVAIWMGRAPSGEVVYTNIAFREVLGIEPPDGAVRGAFVEPYGVHLPTGEVYPEDRMPFEQVLRARGPVVVDDLVVHRRDGRKVHLRVFAKPIFGADGEITHVLEAFIDISREVEAERARAEGERKLARSQRLDSIGQLVTGIAHDFNNLLTVTKLAVSWLRVAEREPERKDALAQISTVTDSAIELIKNLIGFARRGRQIAAPVSLEATMRPVLEMARRTFDSAIVLEADLAAADAMIMGDSSQLEHLVMNLVLNARDAIAGAGKVTVRTRVTTLGESTDGLPPGRYVVLDVVDTGVGIEPAIRDRIFEPYFTTKTQGTVKGTGLGLSIVHGIVESHGGVVEVLDNEPQGTIMRVALPAPLEIARLLDPSAATPEAPAVASATGCGRLVLVVDDEPLVRASTGATLRASGFRVCEAEDGRAAIERFREHRTEIAAVVLDMVMPGLRGGEVILALREIDADVRVLLVTANALDEEVGGILDLGIGGWLPKPYDDRQLLTMLERIALRV